jgi:hypothetical protein
VARTQQYPQLALLERVTAVLKADGRVRAAFLRGSFYSGQPDLYSDLDVFAVVEISDVEAFFEQGRAVLAEVGQLICVSQGDTNPPTLRALFPGPMRVDLSVVAIENIPPYEGWRVLFDTNGVLETRPRPPETADPLQPEHVAAVCDQFWWNLFNSIGQLKRGHLWMALYQLDQCRSTLAQMMRWRRDTDRPVERFIDLEQHLTAEDQQALAQTLADYDLRQIAAALLCAADAFDPAGREVAGRLDAVYPTELAHTTKEYFIREFWTLLAPGTTISA